MGMIKLVPRVPDGAAGGGCRLCGLPRKGDFISTDSEIDYEGRICICETCGLAIARELGCASKRSTEATKAENVRLREVIKGLEARVAELEPLEQAITSALRRVEEPAVL